MQNILHVSKTTTIFMLKNIFFVHKVINCKSRENNNRKTNQSCL